jgi:hypothetical protein
VGIPEKCTTLDLFVAISRTNGQGIHIIISRYEGMTCNIQGFAELFARWTGGELNIILPAVMESYNIPEIVKYINELNSMDAGTGPSIP